ncbi:MAG: FAD binding domain-containing protein [Firmicutes bacterium]|nr:FAD binding domain-containing protein [Bacillota bacterium]
MIITADLVYYKPESVEELSQCVTALTEKGDRFTYYSGGTEIVSALRQNKLQTNALIDIKGIHELTQVTEMSDEYIIGAAVPLNVIIDQMPESLLARVCAKIADRTIRNVLTIGGNLCGRLPYREAVLPLIGMDAEVVLLQNGQRIRKKLSEVFDKRMLLTNNALLYQIVLPKRHPKWAFHKRFTESIGVDYPTVHLVVMANDEIVTVGLSGFASFPVYTTMPIAKFNSIGQLPEALMETFNGQAKSDDRCSADYRNHLLKSALTEWLEVIS